MRDQRSSKKGKHDELDTVRKGRGCSAVAAVSLSSAYLVVILISVSSF